MVQFAFYLKILLPRERSKFQWSIEVSGAYLQRFTFGCGLLLLPWQQRREAITATYPFQSMAFDVAVNVGLESHRIYTTYITTEKRKFVLSTDCWEINTGHHVTVTLVTVTLARRQYSKLRRVKSNVFRIFTPQTCFTSFLVLNTLHSVH